MRALVRERCQRMKQLADAAALDAGAMPSYLPYNLLTQLSIPDKSVADCVESLIGAYLVSCGPKGALVFMNWLGIKVRSGWLQWATPSRWMSTLEGAEITV